MEASAQLVSIQRPFITAYRSLESRAFSLISVRGSKWTVQSAFLIDKWRKPAFLPWPRAGDGLAWR
jgi:hypothetical protein|tara:strand:+ start:221 stop:418 length:198 start_codon:yes stop_codon:yes gene_type:complete